MTGKKTTRGTPPSISRSSRKSAWTASGRKSGDDNFLATYFKEMSIVDVMTPEEEHAAAVRIHELRVMLWDAILSYPPYMVGVCELIRETFQDEEEVPHEMLAEVRIRSRAYRDRETRAHRDAYVEASKALGAVMATVDVDGLVTDVVIDDLHVLATGSREGVRLAVHPARRGSRPFAEYVARVRRASALLRREKNLFVRANLRLVVSIARRFNYGKLPLQDLIQEGNIGLMKAVDRFDHTRGFRFSTYGSWWIRHAISRAIADKGRAVRLPVHMLDAYQKVAKARREFERQHGRRPEQAELAEATGIPMAKLERMDGYALENPVSLDRPVSGDDDRKMVDLLEDTDSQQIGEALELESFHRQVQQIVGELRPIEAEILMKRFGLHGSSELTLKEIGGHYSLSRERIRQLQEQALGKIRRELKRRDVI